MTKLLQLVQFEILCRQQIKCGYIDESILSKSRKLCWKRRKCWLPAFSPFPTMFSKVFFLKNAVKHNKTLSQVYSTEHPVLSHKDATAKGHIHHARLNSNSEGLFQSGG